MHGGTNPGAPEGNRNAWKHGLYSADAVLQRKEVNQLARIMKRLVAEID